MIAGIFAFAVLVRTVLGVATQSWTFPSGLDHWEFGYEMGRVAGSIAGGDGFSYPTHPPRLTAWMPPVYPFLIALAFTAFGSFSGSSALVLESLQIILSAVTSVMLYFLGRRFFGSSRAGMIAALVHAVYLPSIHFSVQKIWSTTLSGALLLLSLILFDDLSRHPAVTRGAWVGVVMGFALLTNPLFLGVIPAQLVWLLLRWRGRGSADPRAMGALLLVLSLTVAPWTIRNWIVFGQLVPIKSNLGHELLLGNHPGATGLLPEEISGIERAVRGFTQPIPGMTMTEEELNRLNKLNETQQNREYLEMATEYITADPGRFLGVTAHRVVRFWSFPRSPKTLGELASHSEYLAVLVLAIIGVWHARRSTLDVSLPLVSLLCFPLGYYVTIVGLYRYRFPVEPILILFAAIAIDRIPSHMRPSSSASSSPLH